MRHAGRCRVLATALAAATLGTPMATATATAALPASSPPEAGIWSAADASLAPISAPPIEGAIAYSYASPGGPSLPLYVMPPPDPEMAATPHAAIVLFHGGAWTSGSPNQFALLARELARQGLTVVLPDYRVHDRQGSSAFEAMTDARHALRWVRVHAGSLHVDPHRIAAGGGSAGGQLALAAAQFPEGPGPTPEPADPSARPDALVLFDPVVDTGSPAWRARFEGRGGEVSPLAHPTKGLPPMLILHGRADVIAPYADVEAFCHRVEAQGDRCRLVGYDGAGHGFFNPVKGGGPGYRQTADEARHFLADLGYTQR
jgi:acetyl esterase/lipase